MLNTKLMDHISFLSHYILLLYECVSSTCLYTGSPSISGDISYSSADQTLTCTSTGGPATTVVWIQNCVIIQESDSKYMQSQNVTNTQTATYENTLRVVGANATISDGVYTCSVSNSRGSASSSVGIGSKFIKDQTTGIP